VKLLRPGFNTEVDNIKRNSWTVILQKFNDASIYQTWPYGSVRWAENNLSHIILKKRDEIVAVAQVRIFRLPFLKAGIAYVFWGPIWRNKYASPEVFRQMVRALREEYIIRRHLFLRLIPRELKGEEELVQSALKDEGFRRNHSFNAYRTILINLRQTVEELRIGFRRRCRRSLENSEKYEFEITHGTELDLYDEFLGAYEELVNRKQFVKYVNVQEFRKIQEELPNDHKMLIMLCKYKGRLVSSLVSSGIGNTALGIFGATNVEGRKLNASYYLRWREILWWKAKGYEWFDFGGINPVRTPGTYMFKSSFLDKNERNGKDVQFIGQYDAYDNYLSKLIVRSGDLLRSNYRRLKERINRKRHYLRKTVDKRNSKEYKWRM